MTAWTCRATRRVLDAYHDGELPVEQQVAVQTHLRQCASCAAERRALRDTSEALRLAAGARVPADVEALGRRVLAQMPIESHRRSIGRRLVAAFDDMRLVWPALGATVATVACLAAGLGFMRLASSEQPASMAALIGALADPGSNQNPLALDGRILLPRAVPAEFTGGPVLDREEALFALAAVVTREGRVQNLELLDSGRAPVQGQAMLDLLDAAAQTRFEPARAGGAPVAVNMVWLLAQTKVRARVAAETPAIRPHPAPRPATPQASMPAPAVTPQIA
jgi:hypothetical protein